MFLKKIFFEHWTSRGVNSGVTQFHTKFRHFFKDIFELCKEIKKKGGGKSVFENIVSDFR